jgi:hypothetical protein
MQQNAAIPLGFKVEVLFEVFDTSLLLTRNACGSGEELNPSGCEQGNTLIEPVRRWQRNYIFTAP